MLTSKQRAYLRGLGNPLDTILMVGKGGMSPEILKQADDAVLVDSSEMGIDDVVDAILDVYNKKLQK